MASSHPDLARLLDPAFLDGIGTASLDDLRERRAACQEAEVGLSYLRRLAQGRLDIVHASLGRLDDGSGPGLAELVDEMPGILSSGHQRASGPGHLPLLLAPDTEDPALTAELDAVLGADDVGRLASLGPEELTDIAGALEEFERRVSNERRLLHEQIDALQAEVVGRYKAGSASVDGLLR
jgi:hypothetical protein